MNPQFQMISASRPITSAACPTWVEGVIVDFSPALGRWRGFVTIRNEEREATYSIAPGVVLKAGPGVEGSIQIRIGAKVRLRVSGSAVLKIQLEPV